MKKNIPNFVLFMLTLLGALSCKDYQNDNGKKDDFGKAKIETFFATYKKSGSSAALDILFSQNLNVDRPALAGLKDTLIRFEEVAGSYMGNHLIVQNRIGNSLVFYSYLVKYANRPMRFTFMFYKPDNDWQIYKFKYDTDAEKELEESGKIYYLYSK